MADQYPKYVNQAARDEHDNSAPPFTKRVSMYLWDAAGLNKVRARGNTDGSFSVGGFSLPAYDYVSNASTSTSDTYSFRLGGSGGALVATVAITYTDATKNTLLTAVRS